MNCIHFSAALISVHLIGVVRDSSFSAAKEHGEIPKKNALEFKTILSKKKIA